MATATINNIGIVPRSRRLKERKTFGDLTAMFEQAIDEQAAGNLANARAALCEILSDWLRQKWIQVSGKVNTPITDPLDLAQKLRSGLSIDPWTHKLIIIAVSAPRGNVWLHVDLLFGVVSAICFGFPTVKTAKGGA